MNIQQPMSDRGYIALADHGLIGNLRTAALVLESYCVPNFDSPSVFARILDKDKGGHFSITPTVPFTTKQSYLPSSNVRVATVTDFLPRQPSSAKARPLLAWLIRRVEVIRGVVPLRVECAPAFNYARAPHTTHLSALENVAEPNVHLELLDLAAKGHKGPGVFCELALSEGQAVTFVLRIPPSSTVPDGAEPTPERRVTSACQLVMGASTLRPQDDPLLTKGLLRELLEGTNAYWNGWIRRSTYQGSWKEAVHRSALALKLLIYEPTGAIVASPTFSLPEYIGGTRNCASWIRDSSFTLYALIRLGYTYEANAYMDFILERLRTKNADGSLTIMYTIHGDRIFPEEELSHLDGHKGDRHGPTAGVAYGLNTRMDCIYLAQKYGKPLSYDTWYVVHVIANYNKPDLEVRNKRRHFTVMMWVAIDRGLRLAEKRSLPCPRRNEWLAARDDLYEQIMQKAWNPESNKDVLDSSLLIMPLVFFMTPADPRFLSTLKQILNTPERGGLTSNGLVYRYDVTKTDDGVGGEEGTFCLCTLWTIEALARAGEFDKASLAKAVGMFEDFLQYTNHLGLCTEEISDAGEALGNAVQGFTHVTLISAAYNLSRMQAKYKA
ncbi:glycoside hydrolase family 15 protein [Amylocystis lapponica]|nr:glycoside hydrolase family 15 protein [Amylocystis lapponica]